MATGIWWEEALISILQWTGQPPTIPEQRVSGHSANSAEMGTQRCDAAPGAALGLFSSVPELFPAILPAPGSRPGTGDAPKYFPALNARLIHPTLPDLPIRGLTACLSRPIPLSPAPPLYQCPAAPSPCS